jgi:hypothetical protein
MSNCLKPENIRRNTFYKRFLRAGGMAQVIMSLSSKWEALSSKPSTARKGRQGKRGFQGWGIYNYDIKKKKKKKI